MTSIELAIFIVMLWICISLLISLVGKEIRDTIKVIQRRDK